MSRTIRRKHYERQHPINSWQPFGIYTTYNNIFVKTGNGHGGYNDYREMTQQEFHKHYWLIHGESKHGHSWGPNKFCRKQYKQLIKTHNRREMLNYLNDQQNYDPQFMARGVALKKMWNW